MFHFYDIINFINCEFFIGDKYDMKEIIHELRVLKQNFDKK